jgi:transposase
MRSASDTLHGLGNRHGISRNLVRIWTAKAEAGEFDDDLAVASMLQEYKPRIGALERLVGKPALENEFLKGLRGTFASRQAGLRPSLPAPWSLGRRRMPADGSRAIDLLRAPQGQPIEEPRLVERIKQNLGRAALLRLPAQRGRILRRTISGQSWSNNPFRVRRQARCERGGIHQVRVRPPAPFSA